ncbi:hypothetical protein ANN_10873, partial [Periplaneta americana]
MRKRGSNRSSGESCGVEIRGLIKALNMLNEKYGKVYIDFAEPISVRELFESSGLQRRLPTPESPQVQHVMSPEETSFCVELAHHVVQQQQRHSVISAFNLMAIILNNSVLEGTGPPLLQEIVANVAWFKSVMEMLGALIDIQGELLFVSNNNSYSSRIDIIAYSQTTKKGYIIDPTIRNEMGSSQSEDVNKEKINIYLPTVDYFKAKYQLEEVIGLLIGARDIYNYVTGGLSSVDAAVKEAISVHKSLVTLTQTNHLKLVKIHTFSRKMDTSKLKGHNLSEQTMDVAVPMVMLQHYVNPCLHYLIGPAILTLVMRHLDVQMEISRNDLFQKFNFLRSLFSNEFAFYTAWAEKEFEDAVKQLEVLSVVEPTKSGMLKLGNHAKLQILLSNLLQPFLEGYLAVCQVLQKVASRPCSERFVLKATQQRVEELLTSAAISHPYSLSLDMHSAALQALTSLHAVDRLK